ncbi:MAG: alpha/beta hydrolase [Rhodospirillaceae bacterium]
MTVVFHFAGWAALLYAAVVAAMYFGQRSLMYPAGRDIPSLEVADLRATAVTARTADGLDLTAWHAAAAPGRPTILYFHGNAGTIADRAYKARLFQAAGYGVLLAEYRGYGGNPGAPDEAGLFADGRAAMALLASLGVMPTGVVLYGESLGTGVAVRIAREQADAGRPVAALVLEAPFTSMADAAAHHYPFIPARLLTRDRYDSLSLIDGVAAPLLILHGDLDPTVPPDHGRRLHDRASEPKSNETFPQAGHNDLYDHGAGEAVVRFLDGLPRR